MSLSQSDRVLAAIFFVFALTAFTIEPLYYFGCEWDLARCPHAPSTAVRVAGRVWEFYTQWDPLFKAVPLWLQVLCAIEVFVFGPLYLLTAIGLARRATWLPAVAAPFCGALIYSTLVYFIMELLESYPGTHVGMVFVVNIPWTVVPLVLLLRLRSWPAPSTVPKKAHKAE